MSSKELSVKKVDKLSLREEAAMATLRTVRQQGHVHIELRKISKRSIFFCTLCLTQCFSEAVLYDHLRGNLHSKRYSSAKMTLLLPNPWPFNDGVLFFDNSREKDPSISLVSDSQRGAVLGVNDGGKHGVGNEKIKKCKGVKKHYSISYALPSEEISKFELEIIGYGHIGAKIHEDSEKSSVFCRIWCAWLGDGNSDGCDELLASPKCDFAIVSFSYTYDLGKGSLFETDESGKQTKKRTKSFSDPEDGSDQYTSSHDAGSSDKVRKDSRKQNIPTDRRKCDICRHPMIPGKDVATLLNLKTGRFACSSRNLNGAFHVFHVSCLIHWILLSEFELWTNQAMNPRRSRGRRGKTSINESLIYSIFCPECLATGIHVEGEVLEKLYILFSETFLYKQKAVEAQKAWMKSPENLQKCSTGLCFPSESAEKFQGKVCPAKLLLFYRADC